MQLASQTSRRANGNRGGNRARVQAAASFSRADLPTAEPDEPAGADPRREMFRWFEEAFGGVRSDLQTLIASMTHQQAMVAELIDNRHAELRLALAAETLPDIVAEAVSSAIGDHTAVMTESFSAALAAFREELDRGQAGAAETVDHLRASFDTALGAFREELDRGQAGTAATVDNLRQTFETFLGALAAHDEGAEKREAARLRALKASITRQMTPLAEVVALLTAQEEAAAAQEEAAAAQAEAAAAQAEAAASRPPRRQPAAARAAALAKQPERDETEREPAPAPPVRAPRVVTGPQVKVAAAPARSPRVVTGAQVKAAAPARSPRVVTGPQVKAAVAPARSPRVVTGPQVKAAATARSPRVVTGPR